MFRRKRNYSYYGYGVKTSRFRMNNMVIAVVAGVILVVAVIVFLNFTRIQLMIKGYSWSEASDVLSLDKDDEDLVLSYDRLDHISDWIDNEGKAEYFDEYEQYLSFNEKTDVQKVIVTIDEIYEDDVPKLKSLGFNDSTVMELIKEGAEQSDFKYLIDHNFTLDDLAPYRKIKGYKISNLESYITAYAEHKNYSYAVNIVNYPFIISSNPAGDEEYTITNPENELILVKKGFYLPNDYEPTLVDSPIPVAPDNNNSKMTQHTADALLEMYNDASKEGYNLVLNSAYRSYQDQENTYKDFETRYGGKYASEYVATPGASEHQTGLGIDLTSQSVVDGQKITFGDTDEYKWVVKNCTKYGFIVRFEDSTAATTGIAHEPWHLRYVGKDIAQKISDKGWTFEEYCLYENNIPELEVRDD